MPHPYNRPCSDAAQQIHQKVNTMKIKSKVNTKKINDVSLLNQQPDVARGLVLVIADDATFRLWRQQQPQDIQQRARCVEHYRDMWHIPCAVEALVLGDLYLEPNFKDIFEDIVWYLRHRYNVRPKFVPSLPRNYHNPKLKMMLDDVEAAFR